MSWQERIIKQIDQTHKGLGQLVAVSMLAHKAKKCLLVVSPAGCGKSTASNLLVKNLNHSKKLDSVTRSGLAPLESELSNYKGLIVVDDLGKIDTQYSRLATVTTFCELVYSHFVEKHTITSHIKINDFKGSAILNCQPVILKKLLVTSEWEATIQDKVLRYYHLFRPLQPRAEELKLELNWGLDIGRVKLKAEEVEFSSSLIDIGLTLWSRSRVKEHLIDLLKAYIALDNRTKMKEDDQDELAKLLKPCKLERFIIRKTSFEEERSLDSNLLCLLVEFASYGKFEIKRLEEDYKISKSTAYKIMDSLNRWWIIEGKSPTKYAPSPDLKEILKEII